MARSVHSLQMIDTDRQRKSAGSELILQSELPIANISRIQHVSPDDFLDRNIQHFGDPNSIIRTRCPTRGDDRRNSFRGKSALFRQFVDRQAAGVEQEIDTFHLRGFHHWSEQLSVPRVSSQFILNQETEGRLSNGGPSIRRFNPVVVASLGQQFRFYRMSIREEQVVHGNRHP